MTLLRITHKGRSAIKQKKKEKKEKKEKKTKLNYYCSFTRIAWLSG